MNVRRFTAKSSREALRLVREALGEDAVVLSTKPSAGGVEVLAMAPESIGHLEQMSAATGETAAVAARVSSELAVTSAEQDAERLEMSTLSFQDYVRKRMLKRRQAAMDGTASSAPQALTPALSREREREPTHIDGRGQRLHASTLTPLLPFYRSRERAGVRVDACKR